MATSNTIVGLYGTLGVPDTLAANTATIYEIGEDRVWQNLELLIAAHNRQMDDLFTDFVEPTMLQYERYGSAPQMDMDEIDEHGNPDSQKVIAGSFVGYPLRKFGRALQWTRDYFSQMTGLEFNEQVSALLDADVRNCIRQIQRALYRPTNYNFVDWLTRPNTSFTLPVKALVNADGAPIPPGPNGQYFDPSTHTHYLGATSAGTLSEADFAAGLNTVLEHFMSGKAMVFINSAQEAAVRAFADFQKLYDTTVSVGANLTYARGDLETTQLQNRRIGTYRGADVWVKYWNPASIVTFLMSGAEKPLAWRKPTNRPDGFNLVYDNEQYPLRCNQYARYFGVAASNRVSAAVLDVAHTTYTMPTI